MPSEALRELEQAPYGLVADVLDIRSFIQTKEALDRVVPGSKIEAPTGPMADRVWEAIKATKDERNEARIERLREAGDGS